MGLEKEIPASHLDLFENRTPCFCATTKANGLLSVHPVSALLEEGQVRFSTLKTRGKYKNLVKDDRVSLCLIDPQNPMRYLEIRGRAVLADDPDRVFIDSIARHHMGMDQYPYDAPDAQRATVTIDVAEVWVQP
ncbi:pyridoxamine 5'-phosphate oxidase family protein [Sphingobium estronivorans]|uniref:pyridoxamine 5'-phosphate oxidase family protein n=1 Tax=Sphingobium estronivorans TaxID=1577690 RepID=UPI00123B1270|nr:pyridoxamine 5'-phosphate oxidase family protein [Sphingobium estronivorans]